MLNEWLTDVDMNFRYDTMYSPKARLSTPSQVNNALISFKWPRRRAGSKVNDETAITKYQAST